MCYYLTIWFRNITQKLIQVHASMYCILGVLYSSRLHHTVKRCCAFVLVKLCFCFFLQSECHLIYSIIIIDCIYCPPLQNSHPFLSHRKPHDSSVRHPSHSSRIHGIFHLHATLLLPQPILDVLPPWTRGCASSVGGICKNAVITQSQCWASYSKNVIYCSLLVTPFKSNIVTLLITFWQQ